MSIPVIIEDTQQLFSKHQKQKIKEWVRSHVDQNPSSPSEHIGSLLDHVHYQGEAKYQDVELIKDDTLRGYKVVFKMTSKRQQLQNRLRQKIKTQSDVRAPIKSEAWSLYRQLIQQPSVQSLPEATRNMVVPNPDFVAKHKALYQGLVDKSPNPEIKHYLHQCLYEAD